MVVDFDCLVLDLFCAVGWVLGLGGLVLLWLLVGIDCMFLHLHVIALWAGWGCGLKLSFGFVFVCWVGGVWFGLVGVVVIVGLVWGGLGWICLVGLF